MSSSEHNYEFDEYRIDTTRRLLIGADDEPIPLKPKVFDTLLCLVSNSGTVVDKAALKRRVWRGGIVEDNSISQHIAQLRRVFGERPGENRFIATRPGRGYQFVGDVRLRSGRDNGWAALASDAQFVPLGERRYRLCRLIRASCERVFAAWTQPEQLRRWYGFGDWALVGCAVDLRVGGHWQLITRNAAGLTVEQNGTYLEIAAPNHLHYSEIWPQMSYGQLRVTVDFRASEQGTAFTLTVQCAERDIRDRLLASAVSRDIGAGLARFARYVEDDRAAGTRD